MWRPSCAQVSCSTNSSSVPMPPGKATKASERSNMMRFRSCMSRVTISSCTSPIGCSRPVRNSGMTPGDLTTLGQHGRGDRAHQADGAAAEDKPDVVLGEDGAERRRCCGKARIGAGTGAAIDADISNRAHEGECAIGAEGGKGEIVDVWLVLRLFQGCMPLRAMSLTPGSHYMFAAVKPALEPARLRTSR